MILKNIFSFVYEDNGNKKIAKSASYVDLRGSVGAKVNLQSGKENTMVLGMNHSKLEST